MTTWCRFDIERACERRILIAGVRAIELPRLVVLIIDNTNTTTAIREYVPQ
jgi:hypothetical protein